MIGDICSLHQNSSSSLFNTGCPAGYQSGFSFQVHTNSSIHNLSWHLLTTLYGVFFLEAALSTAGSGG
jgi:hypothetical protein